MRPFVADRKIHARFAGVIYAAETLGCAGRARRRSAGRRRNCGITRLGESGRMCVQSNIVRAALLVSFGSQRRGTRPKDAGGTALGNTWTL